MINRSLFRLVFLVASTTLLASLNAPLAWSQHGSDGRINVIVTDPQGAVVPGATLSLVDLATRIVRDAKTSDAGSFIFVNLPIGTYSLTVSQSGFTKQVLENVIVQASKTTDVPIKLTISTQAESVSVEAVAPILETSTNVIGTVINPKQIENLPLNGRDLTQLSRLTPGYNGTWNGLPSIAQGNNVDGVIGSPSRGKYNGNSQSSISPRLESIEEMTVQTDQLDMNQGFGQASMQLNFITRRGTNTFHGQLLEDFRNSALNANSWGNNANKVKRPQLKLNDFGGTIGGPILRNKLFFFASLVKSEQPGSAPINRNVLTPAAQAGNYTYRGTDNQLHTINVLQLARNANPSLPNTVNTVIGAQLARINNSLSFGSIAGTANLNVNALTFLSDNPRTDWFETLRLDYDATRRLRTNLSINRTTSERPFVNTPYFPGPDFLKTRDGNKSGAITAAYGLEWTISPTLINQFKAGYLYNATRFDFNSAKAYYNNPTTVPFPNVGSSLTSGLDYYRPVTQFYPVFNASDTISWQKGAHSFNFGFSWYRENDHYWNPPEGISTISLGLVQGDPALTALTNNPNLPFASTAQQGEAQGLYALLTGRISSVFGRYTYDPSSNNYLTRVTAFNLNEVQSAWGLFMQDSWRLRPNLTINYGLRWDFTGDDHDKTTAYHNSDVSSLYGSSGIGNLFNPGSLKGNLNPTIEARPHAYNSWLFSPQPAVGIAWSPSVDNGILGKLVGRDQTVVRASFSLRKFTIPYQFFWDNASDFGTFFYQFFTLTGDTTGNPGTYMPGTLALGQSFPPYAVSPAAFEKVAPLSEFTFVGGNNAVGINGIKQNISQPYTQSWTFGVQRRLGHATVLEVRYNGSRTVKQWINENLNEINVFENGFLNEFKHATGNLAICQANAASCIAAQAAAGIPLANRSASNFGNWGLPGQMVLPIMTAAFAGLAPSAGFTNGTFVNQLNNGQVGSFARTLAGVSGGPYFCNLVGPSFTPCSRITSYKPVGGVLPNGGYPINFFQANPYAGGQNVGYMTDAGYSTYNALQVDLRQQSWHGVVMDANYTWSKTLGVSSPNTFTASYTPYTLRDLRASYGPTLFDAHHVVHINAAYDLPFGRGKRWASSGGVLDRVVGGWNVATIITLQSGFPFRVTSGYLTYNNDADSGVLLNGVTRSQLQDSVGVYRVPGTSYVTLINPKYLTTGSGANQNFIVPNTTPGTLAPVLYLYGPHGFYDDMMVSKTIPITERWRFALQTEFINVFNHPTFANGSNPANVNGALPNVRSPNWGLNFPGGTFGRQIEVRANITF